VVEGRSTYLQKVYREIKMSFKNLKKSPPCVYPNPRQSSSRSFKINHRPGSSTKKNKSGPVVQKGFEFILSPIVSKGRMIVEIQGSVSYFTSKLSTCLLVVIIYPIHIKIIGVVQWYVLCPILSFFCVIIIFTYVFKHGCACIKLEFGRFW